jgi:hypothetical protein
MTPDIEKLEALAKAASPALHVYRPDLFSELAEVCREAVPALIAKVRELEAELDYLFSTGNRKGERPRILDIVYTVFMHSDEPNKEDGGKKDWMNDTKPEAEELIKRACRTLKGTP